MPFVSVYAQGVHTSVSVTDIASFELWMRWQGNEIQKDNLQWSLEREHHHLSHAVLFNHKLILDILEGTEEWFPSSISLTHHPSVPSQLSAVCRQKRGTEFNPLAQAGQALPLSINALSISA